MHKSVASGRLSRRQPILRCTPSAHTRCLAAHARAHKRAWQADRCPPPSGRSLAVSRITHTNGHGQADSCPPHPRGAHSLCRGSRAHTQTGMDRLTAAHPTLGALTRCLAAHAHTQTGMDRLTATQHPRGAHSLCRGSRAHTHKGHGQVDKLPTTLGAPPQPPTANSTRGAAGRGSESSPTPCRNVGTVTRIPSWRSGAQGRPTPSGPHPHPYQSGIAPEPPIGSA